MAPPPSTEAEDAALSLTMAVVASSPGPLLLLDGDLTVVAASASFSAAFELDPRDALGSSFFDLGEGECGGRQLRSLLEATAAGQAEVDAYEMDLKRPASDTRCVVIQARRLAYLDLDHVRVLVAISDVTDARADAKLKNEAFARISVLLQEVRHRVANSLQIIASVLLQNARKTRSDETRGHLKDAHNRVMSVAALERLLSASAEGDDDVRLHDYLRCLCDTISASMIADSDEISLTVSDGDALVPARVSVSLGLIVTELAINALKHGFPEGRRGRITVGYEGRGPNWVLTVSDDGVGMPSDSARVRTGLGTSIVEALAKQLQAVVEVAPGFPGTTISVEHTQLALVVDDATRQLPASDAADQAAALRGG